MISRARRRALDLRRKLELSGRVDVVRVANMLELDVQLWPLENMEELVVDRFICVARRLEPEWRRWVVAHAIGHQLLHPGNHIWIRLHTRLAFKFEREAEEFAGALLMDGSEAIDAGSRQLMGDRGVLRGAGRGCAASTSPDVATPNRHGSRVDVTGSY